MPEKKSNKDALALVKRVREHIENSSKPKAGEDAGGLESDDGIVYPSSDDALLSDYESSTTGAFGKK